MSVKLYNYFRSSASYRVRIALGLKGIKYEYVPVHLLRSGGEQRQSTYLQVNPMGHVPALDHDGFVIAESMAILQYLDDVFTGPRLFPMDPKARAHAIQISEMINSGIQPLHNLKVMQALESDYGLAKPQIDGWVRRWIEAGLASVEKLLERTAGTYCLGGDFTAADAFLIPQCFTCKRFNVPISNYPRIHAVNEAALKLPFVQAAHPERQPDFAPYGVPR